MIFSTQASIRGFATFYKRAIKQSNVTPILSSHRQIGSGTTTTTNSTQTPPLPKILNRVKTPIGKLDQPARKNNKSGSPDPYAPFPNHTNPSTGEVGGPTGPEPTRYGDWERKGRVSDF